MGDSEAYVTEPQCLERRTSCRELRNTETNWIKAIDAKLNWLIFFILAQLCAIVLLGIQFVATQK